MPICFMLLMHWARRAASRAAWTAGSRSAIRTAMIAMTTSNSISVNPRGSGRRAMTIRDLRRLGEETGGMLGKRGMSRRRRPAVERAAERSLLAQGKADLVRADLGDRGRQF